MNADMILAGTLAETDPFWQEHSLADVLAAIRDTTHRTLASPDADVTLDALAAAWAAADDTDIPDARARRDAARRHVGAALLVDQLMTVERTIADRLAACARAQEQYRHWRESPMPMDQDSINSPYPAVLEDAIQAADAAHRAALTGAWEAPLADIEARFGAAAVREGQFPVVAMLATVRRPVEELVRRGADPAILASEYRPDAVLAVARADLDRLRDAPEPSLAAMRALVTRYARVAPVPSVAAALNVDEDVVMSLAGAAPAVAHGDTRPDLGP